MDKLINNIWYYENSATVILTHEGERIVESQLNDNDVCDTCGSRLSVATMIEGSFISCSKNIYHITPGYEIEYGNYDEPPKIIREGSNQK